MNGHIMMDDPPVEDDVLSRNKKGLKLADAIPIVFILMSTT